MRNTSISFTQKISAPINLEGLSLSEAKASIDSIEQSLRSQESKTYEIAFQYSDPLDHPDLDEIISYVASTNILVAIFTRGTKLTEEMIASWAGKVASIELCENLDRYAAECDDEYEEEVTNLRDLPLPLARLENAARAVKIPFSVAKKTSDRVTEQIRESEYNSTYKFYELNVFDKGLAERHGMFYNFNLDSEEVRQSNKSTLFPGEDTSDYEIREDGFKVTVRRTSKISDAQARDIMYRY